MSSALIIVDVQKDFVDGSLAVPDAESIFDNIIDIAENYDHVVFTRDFHPKNHFSFSENPEFRDGSWPSHCVQGTPGVEIDPRLLKAFPEAPVFSKGTDPQVEAYSGFDGADDDGDTLVNWLDEREVDDVGIVGLAKDYCVKATAKDSQSTWYFHTTVHESGVRGVSPETSAEAERELREVGVKFVD